MLLVSKIKLESHSEFATDVMMWNELNYYLLLGTFNTISDSGVKLWKYELYKLPLRLFG